MNNTITHLCLSTVTLSPIFQNPKNLSIYKSKFSKISSTIINNFESLKISNVHFSYLFDSAIKLSELHLGRGFTSFTYLKPIKENFILKNCRFVNIKSGNYIISCTSKECSGDISLCTFSNCSAIIFNLQIFTFKLSRVCTCNLSSNVSPFGTINSFSFDFNTSVIMNTIQKIGNHNSATFSYHKCLFTAIGTDLLFLNNNITNTKGTGIGGGMCIQKAENVACKYLMICNTTAQSTLHLSDGTGKFLNCYIIRNEVSHAVVAYSSSRWEFWECIFAKNTQHLTKVEKFGLANLSFIHCHFDYNAIAKNNDKNVFFDNLHMSPLSSTPSQMYATNACMI